MDPADSDSSTGRGASRPLLIVAIALVAAIVLSVTLTTLITRGVITDPAVEQVLGYVVFWGPFVLGAWLVYRGGSGSGILLRFRWIDLLWGFGIGFIARSVATIIELAVYGRVGAPYLGSPADASVGSTLLFVLTAFVVPLVLGPVIEELFFRGAVLGALRRSISAGSITERISTSSIIAVVASAAIFALMHLFSAATPAVALASGLSTFVFGLGAGAVALATNRLGGAIIAHVVFNGTVIALGLML